MDRYRQQLIGIFFFCLGAAWTAAEPISRIIAQATQTQTQFAILAVDAASGSILYQKNAAAAMIPASNMKLVTTAAAVHYLGAPYRFQTTVGLLADDLVIIGGGDPLLGEPKLDAADDRAAGRLPQVIIDALKTAGRTSVGNILIDASFFDMNQVHPSWPVDQLNQWYACEVSGLNFYNNCVRVVATRDGGRATLTLEPANAYVTLVNQLKLINKGSSAVGAYRTTTANRLLVKGRLHQQAGFDVAIEQPQGLLASVLRDRLSAAGIAVTGGIVQKYVKHDPAFRVLHTVETPLAEVIARSNKDSLGLAAECLVKTISAENTQGRINGEWPHGQALIGRYLASLKVPADQVVLDDGSGLSRQNRLSATAVTAVLKDMYDRDAREMFYGSLAVGGIDGTIGKYFRQAPYQGCVRGKTGYIDGVRSFSGICQTPRGDILFSILTEGGDWRTRGCINAITEAIFDGTIE